MVDQEKLIDKRSEILFIYDCKDVNPNGDPLDENKPRIDEKTGINIVTDVRLKRTIRDYLLNTKNEIFVKINRKENGELMDKNELIRNEKITTKKDAEKLIKKYIDLRLFGATIGLKENKEDKGEQEEEKSKGKGKGSSITYTGPVQFRLGRSLNKVAPLLIKGTTVMPSKKGLAQGTFTENWIVPYSLIAFYGIVNENASKETNLSVNDKDKLFEGLWNGTKALITRSKMGQLPKLLLEIIYKERNYHIGDLDRKIKIKPLIDEEKIRNFNELEIDFNDLITSIKNNKDKIEGVRLKSDISDNLENELKKYVKVLEFNF